MTTDGPDPTPCADDIYKNGTLMFQTASIGGSNAIERWVQRIAKTSAQPVDWHFAGGRVMVLALGDLARVRDAIREHMSQHDAMFRAQLAALGFEDHGYQPARPGWWTDADRAEVDTAPRVVTLDDGTLALDDPEAAAVLALASRVAG